LDYTDSTTVHGQEYYYAVTTVNALGLENRSIISDSFSAIANDTIDPRVTTDLDAINNNDGSITISWLAVTLDVEGNSDLQVQYWVFRTLNITELNTSSTAERLTVTSSLNHTDINVTSGDIYTYVVTTIDDGLNYNGTILFSNQAELEATECSTSWNDWSSWSACSGSQ